VFGAGVGAVMGVEPAEQFFAGYLLEQSLSIDNLFVFILVFRYPPLLSLFNVLLQLPLQRHQAARVWSLTLWARSFPQVLQNRRRGAREGAGLWHRRSGGDALRFDFTGRCCRGAVPPHPAAVRLHPAVRQLLSVDRRWVLLTQ
jgi:hypothetical protein